MVESLFEWGNFGYQDKQLLKERVYMAKARRLGAFLIGLIGAFVSSSWPLGSIASEVVDRDSGHFQWGIPRGNLAVSAMLAAQRFTQHAPIALTLVLKNVGATTIRITRNFAYLDYDISVIDQSGRLVGRRTDVRVGSSESIGGNTLELQPGQVQMETIDLSLLYNLRAGEYSLKAERPVSGLDGTLLATPQAPLVRFSIK